MLERCAMTARVPAIDDLCADQSPCHFMPSNRLMKINCEASCKLALGKPLRRKPCGTELKGPRQVIQASQRNL